MNPGIVEDIGALGYLEKSGALLEGLFAHSRNALELVAAGDLSIRFAVFDDFFGGARS